MTSAIIDKAGFRLNVGIIVCNQQKQLLWARRKGQDNAWQFPQGGIQPMETTEEAMYRELDEELGLQPQQVKVLSSTKKWLTYRLPEQYIRYNSWPRCIGQKQKWFLLELLCDESCIRFDQQHEPEFDAWQWVDYWYPVDHVIHFKKDVYSRVLTQFESVLEK